MTYPKAFMKPNLVAAPRHLSSYLLPSLADTLFVALFVALCYGNPRLLLLSDAGIGWHIRTGEWILQHRVVPHTDLFSNVPTRVWFAWEWLFDVVIACIHGWGGLNGVLAFSALLMALCFALLLRWTMQRGAPMVTALIFVALAVMSSTVHALARPHLVTWLFTVVCWYLLEQKRKLWLIPALVWVWVNMHGGFLVAFALMGLSLLGDFCSAMGWPDRDRAAQAAARRDCRRLGGVLAASFLASLINPYGFGLYKHIYEYLRDPFIRQHNLEMQAPDFHMIGAKAFAALLLVAGLIVVKLYRQLHLRQILVILFFTASALLSVRNVPLAAIVLTLTVAPLLTKIQSRFDTLSRSSLWQQLRGFSRGMEAMETQTRGHVWAILSIVLMIAACGNGGRLFGRDILHAGFNPERFPLRAVDFLAQNPVQSPLFTNDAWGGYVIYRDWPGLQVVVDDRHDMYGSAYMRNYLKIVHGEEGWETLLDATGARSVLIAKGGKLASTMRGSPHWLTIYQDDQAIVLAHN